MALFGQEHVERYQATDGEEGYDWRNGTSILLLTTTGHRSGKQRTTPLIFTEDGSGRYVVIASKGGAPEHPAWFKNLDADPEAAVQVKADKFTARARVATGDERAQLWKQMTEAWPDYDDYAQKTDREIPVVVLERA
jgi:deazaflavin-dependent oxidoreductase (nitroreductase family)